MNQVKYREVRDIKFAHCRFEIFLIIFCVQDEGKYVTFSNIFKLFSIKCFTMNIKRNISKRCQAGFVVSSPVRYLSGSACSSRSTKV